LWFKDVPGVSNADSAFMDFIDSVGFPILSVPTNIASGFKDISEGDTLKGWEKLNPSALTRSPAVAYRYSQEGVLTNKLDSVKYADEFTDMQLLMQGLGFKTSGLAETLNANNVIQREKAAINKTRQDILNRYFKAEKRGNGELLDKVDKQIVKFNSMYPGEDLAITEDVLDDYIERRATTADETERGSTIEDKFDFFDPLRDVGLGKLKKEAK
jgi:hypothetical protein